MGNNRRALSCKEFTELIICLKSDLFNTFLLDKTIIYWTKLLFLIFVFSKPGYSKILFAVLIRRRAVFFLERAVKITLIAYSDFDIQ